MNLCDQKCEVCRVGAPAVVGDELAEFLKQLPEWGRVSVTWWTHKIKGLHQSDFIMASKIDNLLNTTD